MQALLGSLLSNPLPVATLSFNPANGLQTAQLQIAAADQLSDVGRATCMLRNLSKRRKREVQFIEKIGQKRFGVYAIVGL